MIDTLVAMRSHLDASALLARLGLQEGGYLVVTLHRPALVDGPLLADAMAALANVARTLPVVFPVHPRTRERMREEGLVLGDHIRVIEPLSYLELASLASQARVIVTDSGGLQKEAYWYGVPCVTMRPSTEWVDTVEVGANRLVDDDPDAIARAVTEARMPAERPVLYGDGRASQRIAEILLGSLSPR
jgi:UDP-N-acetylglucosamine 2-epimerase